VFLRLVDNPLTLGDVRLGLAYLAPRSFCQAPAALYVAPRLYFWVGFHYDIVRQGRN
jgi:hypothetical protein